MATTSRSRSHASRAADATQSNLQLVPSSEPEQRPQETPKAKAAPKPTATADLGPRQVTYRFPVVTLADGTELHCKHVDWGHQTEAAAKRCASVMAYQAGQQLAASES